MFHSLMTQYRLTLTPRETCRPLPEWGYRLYAALLETTPQTFASALHEDGPTPLSQYLSVGPGGPVWSVTLLGEESHVALAEHLDTCKTLFLRRNGLLLDVAGREVRAVPDVDALLARGAACGPLHRLRFLTPTAFKSRGRYICLPTARLIVQSLIKKWNASFPDCPIEDADGQGMDALADGLRPGQFRLKSLTYHLKGSVVPGFVGELAVENHLAGFHRQLAGALLLFAGYAGVGIKTTLGMGGTEHEII